MNDKFHLLPHYNTYSSMRRRRCGSAAVESDTIEKSHTTASSHMYVGACTYDIYKIFGVWHTRSGTAHPLGYGSPARVGLTCSCMAHQLEYGTPARVRLTRSGKAHPLGYGTPARVRLTRSGTAQPIGYGTPDQVWLTRSLTAPPLGYGSPAQVCRTRLGVPYPSG